MTKDFKNMRKWTEADEITLDDLMKQLAAVALFIVAVITLVIVMAVEPVQAINVTNAATDLLMSPDMAEYSADQGSGLILTEEDME